MAHKLILAGTLVSCALGLTATAHSGPPGTVMAGCAVSGGPGGFDWMLVDRAHNRFYATHGGTKSLTVLDLKTGAVRGIATGAVSGVAVDTGGAGCSRAGTIINWSFWTTKHWLKPARSR